MADNRSQIQLNDILPAVYDDLRRLASQAMDREPQDHTYQTTDLVHETYVRLAAIHEIDWADEKQLLRASVGVMRRVLIDYARAKCAQKRSPPRNEANTPAEQIAAAPADISQVDMLTLEDALCRLQAVDQRKAEIVELRYYGGQSIETIAELLDISTATVKRDWTMAKAWLMRELNR